MDKLYAGSEQLSSELRHRDEELENIRMQVSLLEQTHQQFDGQMAVLQGNIDNNNANIARIEEELQGQADRSGGISAQLEQTRQRITQIESDLQQKRTALDKLQQELTAMTANAQGMTRQFLELRATESNLTADIAGREADLRGLDAALQESDERLQQLNSDLEAGTAREKEARAAWEDCKKELHAAEAEVTAANNTIAGYALRQESRVKHRDELEQQLREMNTKLDGIQAKIRVFRAMERDFESYQKSVRTVMQESQRGALRNVHGPVSRLIRTDDEYTVAIEIALGGAMQQVVVDNEQDAKAAIAHLKRTGGGRATFLPISVIKGKTLDEKGVDNAPGFVGIASELVNCDQKYRGIVDNLLGRIVITENIDTAVATAKKFGNRFKIVSLDGQVVNPGGSMTGGSVNKEAGILSRANELEKLTKEETQLQKKAANCETDLQEAQRIVDEAEFQMNTAKEQLRGAEDQVLRLQGQEKQHEIMVQAISEAMSSARREKESIDARTAHDRERHAAQTAKIQVFTAQLTEIKSRIEALEYSQQDATAAMSDLTEQITVLKADEAAMDAEKNTAQNHIADLQSLCRDMEGDRDKKLALIDSIREDTQRLTNEIAAVLARQQDNDEETLRMRKSMETALAQRAEAESAKTRCEKDTQDKNKYILDMERECARLEHKKETTALEERQIIDKLWDSYELTPGTAVEKRGEIESVAAGTRRIAELKRKISALGTPNLGAIEEYARVNERYSYLTEQRDDVLNSKRELETIIRNITQEMTTIFVAEFQKIDHHFGVVFEEMFGGGKGQLILENPEEPLTCGIEIRVQPPGKQVKTITLLSGGEKAFVATALYFAILKVRPTPFCLLDEIDAALDDRNVERFASYLHNLSKNTQFIVITHRRGTMEASDVLYGVTMQEQGVSKLLRLDLNQMEEYLGIVE